MLWVVVAVALGLGAYYQMYISDPAYDDAGDWMIGLSSFIQHGGLYSTIYSQCGPFYYEFWWAVYAITGLTLDPDTGYFMSLCIWIVTCVLIGGAIWLFTRRVALGLLGLIAVWILLEADVAQPMEPAHLSYLIVGAVLVVVCLWPRISDRGRLYASAVGAALCLMAVFTKVNIGALVTCGICFAAATCWPNPKVRRVTLPAAAVALMLTPLVVMWPALTGPTSPLFRNLFILMEISLFALLAAALLPLPEGPGLRERDAQVAVASAAATTALISVIVIADGTPVARLVSGALTGQSNLVNIFRLPPGFPSWTFAVASASALFALITMVLSRRTVGRWDRSTLFSPPAAMLRLAVGIWMLIAVCEPERLFRLDIGISTGQFALAVPLVWIAVIGCGEKSPQTHFARLMIAAIGALGCLEAYPVAAAQEAWAALSLVPVAMVCISDGIELLKRGRRGHRLAEGAEWALLSVLAVFLIQGQIWPWVQPGIRGYYGSVSLGVPGSTEIRVPLARAITVRRTTNFLRRNCATFESSPGMNSFYFYAQESPPTGLNTTQWRRLLNTAQQKTIVNKIRTAPRLCVLSSAVNNYFWYSTPLGPSPPASPLYRYIQRNFVPVATYGIYTVEVRRKAAH